MKQIIVFDTGTGGKIFANHFRQSIPGVKVTEVIDYTNSPYGSRSPFEISTLTEHALAHYLNQPDNLIVLACNTATAYALTNLRTKYPHQIFIGTEPGLKAATQLTRNGKVLVLATPATLRSARYQNLKREYAAHLNIYEPNCAHWAKKIDHGTLTPDDISATLSPFQSYQPDTLILACTHYLAIPPRIFANLFPSAAVYSPLPAITAQVKALLPQL